MENKETKNKIWAFAIIGALILTSLIYYMANEERFYMYLVVYIWFGLAYGMMLQYGRFCFASASRDLFVVGATRMAIGIIIALIFFSLVQAVLDSTGMSTFHAGPRNIAGYLIGAAIFGLGMVFAGGCASGSLYKIGEGNGTSMLAITGISFSQAILASTSWFDSYVAEVFKYPKITIAQLLSGEAHHHGTGNYFLGNALLNTILPALLLIVVIYFIWGRKGFIKKRRKLKGEIGFTDELAGIWNMLTMSKKTTIMGILIGITAGLHIFVMKGMQIKFDVANFGFLLEMMDKSEGLLSKSGRVFDPGYWYITTQEAQLAGWLMHKLGINMMNNTFFGSWHGLPNLWDNAPLMMSIGIVLGAMVMARFTNEFKFKAPKGELIFWGLVGGTLMGIGARIALGCNIGAFFIRIAGGDPMGWVFGVGMLVGVYIGVKILNWWTERKMQAQF